MSEIRSAEIRKAEIRRAANNRRQRARRSRVKAFKQAVKQAAEQADEETAGAAGNGKVRVRAEGEGPINIYGAFGDSSTGGADADASRLLPVDAGAAIDLEVNAKG
jgi:hypothetical protein